MGRKRTPEAEAALKRARSRADEVAASPEVAWQVFTGMMLPFIAPERREGAIETFQRGVVCATFRRDMAEWMYEGAVKVVEGDAGDE